MRFRRQPEQVEDRSLSRESLPTQMLATTAAGTSVSVRGSLALADVYSCVRLLSDVCSTLPLKVYRRTGTSRQQVHNATDALLQNPAPGVTMSQLVAGMVAHYSLWGEVFVGLIRDGGEVQQIELLAPDRVLVQLVNGEPVYQYSAPLGQIFFGLTRRDVVHCRGMSLDGLRGASPIALCRNALGLSAALSQEAESFACNSSTPHGILTVPGGAGAQESAENLAAAWRERHRGSAKAGTVAVLSGDVGFTPISMSRRDAEYVASRELSTREIARLWRIPPSLINADSAGGLTYATVELEGLSLARYTLAPILSGLEQALSSVPDLFPPDFFCEFDLTGLLRGDSAGRAAFYAAGISSGWLMPNEARRMEGLGPLPPGYQPPSAAGLAPLASSLDRESLAAGVRND